MLVTVMDVSVTLRTQDPFGQISDGFLTIQCRIPLRVSAQPQLDTRSWLVTMGEFETFDSIRQLDDQSYGIESRDNRVDFRSSVASDSEGNLLYEITII